MKCCKFWIYQEAVELIQKYCHVLKFSICCHPVNMTDNWFLDIKNFCLNPLLIIPMYRDLYLWYVVSNKLNLLLPSNWIYCSLSCCRLLSYNTSVVFKVSVENSLLRWSYMYTIVIWNNINNIHLKYHYKFCLK